MEMREPGTRPTARVAESRVERSESRVPLPASGQAGSADTGAPTPVSLAVELAGIRMQNPVMTASGTFGYAQEFEQYMDLNRLGALVVKTITRLPRAGNPPPRVVETPSGMLNAIGLQNVGVESFIRDKLPYLRTLQPPLIVNVAGESVEVIQVETGEKVGGTD